MRGPRALVTSLRFRITATATVAVAVALVIGAFAVTEVQTRALTDNTDRALRVRADDLASLLAEDRLPDVLSVRDAEEALVEVVDADGTIVAASANTGGESFLAERFVPEGEREIRTFEELPIEDDEFRVLAQHVETADGTFTIYVAENLEDVRESSIVLNRTLVVAVPLLALLVAVLTWLVVGRALAPVEAIRSEVASISGDELHRRVPEPAARDEIGRLARTMNAMLGRLEAAQQRQRRFVADASHELRSPLTSIRTEIEVDLARPEAADPLATERSVLEETARLEQLIDDLLQLARADDRAELRAEPVDVDDIVFREIERARARGGPEIDASGVSGAQALADRGQLGRAIRNLLDNATRHAQTRVTATLAEEGDSITLAITDDGPGIPEAERERIFERFTRLDDARSREAGGAGLGLPIAREIAERHGGSLDIDPDYSGGARFVLSLPAAG